MKQETAPYRVQRILGNTRIKTERRMLENVGVNMESGH